MYAKSTSRYYRGGKRIKEKKNAAGQIRIIITGRFIRAQSERGGNDVSYRLRSTRRRGAGEPENSNPRQSSFFFSFRGLHFYLHRRYIFQSIIRSVWPRHVGPDSTPFRRFSIILRISGDKINKSENVFGAGMRSKTTRKEKKNH